MQAQKLSASRSEGVLDPLQEPTNPEEETDRSQRVTNGNSVSIEYMMP